MTRERPRTWPGLNLLTGALFTLPLLLCSTSSQSQDSKELVFAGPGGSLNEAVTKAYLVPFEKETGITIKSVEAGDNPIAAVQPQVKSGNVLWDYVACPIDSVVAFPELWEPIDHSKVPSVDLLSYKLDPLSAKYFAVLDIQSFLMAYSTKVFSETKPKSWADFFDVAKFPGSRGIPNVGLESATFVPMAALLADGVSPKDLFPLDLDRAYAKLDKLRPHIRVIWTSFGQSQDILRSGEVVMNFMTDGRAGVLAASGAPIGLSFNQAMIELGGFCIPKGAPNKDAAFRLYEFMLSHPKQQAVFTSMSKYGPQTDAGAKESLALGVKDFTTLHLEEAIPQSAESLQYVQKNSDMLLKRWNEWVEKQ